jgi:uncharacterized protein (DUF2267 family)
MSELEELSMAVHTADGWIDDLQHRLDWQDRAKVYGALLAALHAFRDVLTRDEIIYIGAQLPPLLRGLYYEGWHPGARGIARSRPAFLERIHDALHRDPGIDPEQVARAVFAVLEARLPGPEIEAAKGATPRTLHNLWPS